MKHAAKLAARTLAFTLAATPTTYAQQSPQTASEDIVGIKPGMSPDQVQSVIKARAGRWSELKTQLVFQNQVGTGQKPVPNGAFVSIVAQADKPPGGVRDYLMVYFTPVPGHEEVAAVTHTVQYYGSPTLIREANFLHSLAEKFGEFPSGAAHNHNRDPYPAVYTWGIGARQGAAGFPCDPGLNEATGADTAATAGPGGQYPSLLFSMAGMLPTVAKRGCGDLITKVQWEVTDHHAPADQRILSSYTVSYVDPKRTLAAIEFAQKLSRDAQAADTRGAAQQAAGNKPVL